MPITVQYSPVTGMGLLAATAGAGAGRLEARKQQFAEDVASLQLSQQAQAEANRQAAQNRAFSLQQAMADRMATEQRRTPAADHIAERVGLARAERDLEQKQFRTQLDSMLEKGSIDPAQYQKGLLAVMTGNSAMMAQIMATPKVTAERPNISNVEEVGIIRQSFREKRRRIETQSNKILDNLFNPADIAVHGAAVQKQLDDLDTQETEALEKWRAEGRGQVPTEAPTATGSMTITRPPKRTPRNQSEQNILNYMRSQGSKMPGWEPTTETTVFGLEGESGTPTKTGEGILMAPSVEQRIVGQTYLLPNGKQGVWRGTGWEVK